VTPTEQDDDDWIEVRLNEIYGRALSGIIGWDHLQVREYIDVCEYGLALDGLAHAYLQHGNPVQSDLRRMFDALAEKMGMKTGDRWTGVDRLRFPMRCASPPGP
jgi:hypothetical protein